MSHRRCLLSLNRHPPAALGGPSRVKSSSAQIVFFAISKVLLGPNPCQRGPDPGKAAKKGDGVARLGTISHVSESHKDVLFSEMLQARCRESETAEQIEMQLRDHSILASGSNRS